MIKDNKRTDYPGNEVANKIQKYWNTKCKKQIKFVKGDEWFAGNLSYHLKSRPKWSFDNNYNEIKIGICDNGQYILVNKSELK